MRMTGEEFLAWPRKAITLLGMSGVGKTTLANKLPKSRWFHYSGDYRIGTKYLAEPILDNIKRQAMQVDFLRDLLRSDSIYIASNVTVHNLAPVASFLGKIGREDLGGLNVDEFKARQRLHEQAEIGAMCDVEQFIGKANEIYGYKHFINDAGGSLCELDDRRMLDVLADNARLPDRQALRFRRHDGVAARQIEQPAVQSAAQTSRRADLHAAPGQRPRGMRTVGIEGVDGAANVGDSHVLTITPDLLQLARRDIAQAPDSHKLVAHRARA